MQADDIRDMRIDFDYHEHNENTFFFLLTLQIFEMLADEQLPLDELHFHLMDDTMLDTAELVGVVDT